MGGVSRERNAAYGHDDEGRHALQGCSPLSKWFHDYAFLFFK
jgi:hypothetical protein